MKIKLKKEKTNKVLIIGVLLIGLLGTGCSYFAKYKEKAEVKIQESTKENNSAAFIANQQTQLEIAKTKTHIEHTNWAEAKLTIYGAEAASSITSQFLRRNENILGKPLEDQTKIVNNLLSTNPAVRLAEEKRQNIKEDKEGEYRKKIEELEAKLLDYGQKYEAEKNKNIVKKVWQWSLSTLGIGGIIALCVFFPFLIPIFTQIIAKIISVIPSLASAFGVVAKKTLENTSKGIGTLRAELKKEKELAPDKKYTAAEVLDRFDTKLKIALDNDDKKFIEAVRQRLNL